MILVTAAAIGGVGLICGAALAAAARFMAVKEDPRIEAVQEILPGVNCGGCGFAGCADYAKGIIVEGAAIDLCAPGGNATLEALSRLMGVAAEARQRRVAIVLCGGDRVRAIQKHAYNGVADCRAAAAVGGGDKGCRYGCLGYGSCSRACPVGAIELREGLAVVHPPLCIGCGACVKTCPRGLIRMAPESRRIHVFCSSADKGPVVKKLCKVGCIGCTVCVKLADNAAITMSGALAVVDYDKELTNVQVIEKCPGKCILERRLNAGARP